ncbi:MAG: hypothetical protein U0790_11885 [Isosphaeraceae bacterium]
MKHTAALACVTIAASLGLAGVSFAFCTSLLCSGTESIGARSYSSTGCPAFGSSGCKWLDVSFDCTASFRGGASCNPTNPTCRTGCRAIIVKNPSNNPSYTTHTRKEDQDFSGITFTDCMMSPKSITRTHRSTDNCDSGSCGSCKIQPQTEYAITHYWYYGVYNNMNGTFDSESQKTTDPFTTPCT